ncbi:MAG: hypothetical protein MJZ12_00250 [Prevotella sp.]|nr:hypothetical protein [Prevotella sp.]
MAKGKKTGGRVAGTPNKLTPQAKAIVVDIVNNNAQKANDMLNLIVDPKDWMHAYTKLLEFVVPKQAAVSVSGKVKRSDLMQELLDMENEEQ